MTCAELLIVGGAVLEIGGVFTVGLEIAASLRRAGEIKPKGITVHAPPARSYVSLANGENGAPCFCTERPSALPARFTGRSSRWR